MQCPQEHLNTIVYAKFGGQTKCIMGNSKTENSTVHFVGLFASKQSIFSSLKQNNMYCFYVQNPPKRGFDETLTPSQLTPYRPPY